MFLSTAQDVKLDIDNSAAYVQHWYRKLKQDRQLLIQASSDAWKAASFIMDCVP